MPVPYSDLQNLHQTSPLIELYTLDLTVLGGSIYRFTNTPNADGGVLTFGGFDYTPIPIMTEGWDFTSTGAPPKPKLTVSNVNRTLLADVIGLGDIVGATLTRIRTYAKYLDDQPTADSGSFIGPESYIVEQKTGHNKDFIQWQLTSVMDRLGLMLPRRQVLKDKGFPGVSRTRVPG